ncbi:Uu.00g030280.m01.CDS01 [Anthostomella pinea]|uniref:Uu.00g030280.m01.CDS01 n=1 Tax=Anthostomella pinea TaxID=933095 RepID=A0AAI8YCY0_9PEZI|nr:Uu.00g030280.m01.CDS01 [Anthostomella pinea]
MADSWALDAQLQATDEDVQAELVDQYNQYSGSFDFEIKEDLLLPWPSSNDRSNSRSTSFQKQWSSIGRTSAASGATGSGNEDPSIRIPEIIAFLSSKDSMRNGDIWPHRIAEIEQYLENAEQRRQRGDYVFTDLNLVRALHDARVMVRVHHFYDKRRHDAFTPWTEETLQGQIRQERLLTYPMAFPPPTPSRAQSEFKRIENVPRPDDWRLPSSLSIVATLDPGTNQDANGRTLPPLKSRTGTKTVGIGVTCGPYSLAQPERIYFPGQVTDDDDDGAFDDEDIEGRRPGGVLDPAMAEVMMYCHSENWFFGSALRDAKKQSKISTATNLRFDMDNEHFERCIKGGLAETCANVPPYDNTIDPSGPGGPSGGPPGPPGGPQDPNFYPKRGWQRAALQQCLNMFTNHENRVINTMWRRPIFPYNEPIPLPKEIVYHPRVLHIDKVPMSERDPFPWVHWSNQYQLMTDYLATWQRRRYNKMNWEIFEASALPMNFRGPQNYRGIAVYDDYWLKIGEYLEQLLALLVRTWGVAPRPLLRAILRDIDAGRTDPVPAILDDNNYPNEDEETPQYRREKNRLRRRDIMRRPGIDFTTGTGPGAGPDEYYEAHEHENRYKLVDERDIGWLRYLCQPSRTLKASETCSWDNLQIIFDAKLQLYFADVYNSGGPDHLVNVWTDNDPGELVDDIRTTLDWIGPDVQEQIQIQREAFPIPTVVEALAYINGCGEDEVKDYSNNDPYLLHPNKSYQFSLAEAETFLIEMQKAGRCKFHPATETENSKVERPDYDLHPEDRVRWRYATDEDRKEQIQEFRDDITTYYHVQYPTQGLMGTMFVEDGGSQEEQYAKELAWMLDHVGVQFPGELACLEYEINPALRMQFITRHIKEEESWVIEDFDESYTEYERRSPMYEDLMSWQQLAKVEKTRLQWVKELRANQAAMRPPDWAKDLQIPWETNRTPERTCQFFRNLAYRMGRTLRHVDMIRERHLNKVRNTWKRPVLLDMSDDKKEPRPVATSATQLDKPDLVQEMVQIWEKPISVDDYGLAVDAWNEDIRTGRGEVNFMPPDIQEVIDKADPGYTVRSNNKDENPFTILREGIIGDLVRNRPMLYPGRHVGLLDQNGSNFKGVERPSLFAWATREQRRFQAKYTREHFFSMRRCPLHRQSPARKQTIETREDEIVRRNPTNADQEFGILTYRIPLGQEKPDIMQQTNSGPTNKNPFGQKPGQGYQSPPISPNKQQGKPQTQKPPPTTPKKLGKPSISALPDGVAGPLTKIQRADDKYVAGAAIFPAGETLLQQTMISRQLEQALYPQKTYLELGFKGNIKTVWKKITENAPPQIPLLPPIKRSEIPRSNPLKRKVPRSFMMDPKYTVEPVRTSSQSKKRSSHHGGSTQSSTQSQQLLPPPADQYDLTTFKWMIAIRDDFEGGTPAERTADLETAKNTFGGWFIVFHMTEPHAKIDGLLYALISSWKKMHPKQPCPTALELRALFNDPRMPTDNRQEFLDNNNLFSHLQITTLLVLWGESRNIVPRLCYFTNSHPAVLPVPQLTPDPSNPAVADADKTRLDIWVFSRRHWLHGIGKPVQHDAMRADNHDLNYHFGMPRPRSPPV